MVLSAFALVSFAGCHDEPANTPNTECAQSHPKIKCDSTFVYEARKFEGGLSVGPLAGSGKTEVAALRAIDRETEQYAESARRLCEEYNACAIEPSTYSLRSENLRRRLAKVPELFESVKNAPDDVARSKALSLAYDELAPESAKDQLSLAFSVEATLPNGGPARVVHGGESLPTGTKVAFVVKPSRTAYVYLFQKSPEGTVNTLFPEPRMGVSNPLSGGTNLRLPPAAEASFTLNDRDIGTERVYVVASLEPIPALDGKTLVAQVAPPGEATRGCTRALEYTEGKSQCVRPRGLEYDEGPRGARASMRARAEAGDSVIVQTFSFEHTR